MTQIEREAYEYANQKFLVPLVDSLHTHREIVRQIRTHRKEAYKAGYAAALRWIPCSEQMPKMGDVILLDYPLNKERSKWSWVAGEVDGSDDGLFVDFDIDGQPITTECFWKPIYPRLTQPLGE